MGTQNKRAIAVLLLHRLLIAAKPDVATADFKAEQDRVQAALRRARETEDFEDRAEFDRDLPVNSKKPDSPRPRVEQQPQRGDTVPR